MKKIVSMLGIVGLMCLFPDCKKGNIKPEPVYTPPPTARAAAEMAVLNVLLDSKPCSKPQEQFTSATLDIRGIKVYNTVQGWEDLTPVPGAWDVVSLQTATVPVADITETTSVHSGTITKIKLSFGDNNHLVVNNQQAHCYSIGVREVTLDLNVELHPGTLNELVLSIDICGNISVQSRYEQEPCYTLNPVMAFESFTVR